MRQSWPLLDTATGHEAAWQALDAGDGAFINEQLAHRDGLAPGDPLHLRSPQGP
ncbi:hypothetical protein [Modicisalibacter luteus]